MENLIKELKTIGHVLFSEQQVQEIMCSLPHSWGHMKVKLTHNESIVTFDDASCHLELEDECLEVAKSSREVFMAKSSQTQASGS